MPHCKLKSIHFSYGFIANVFALLNENEITIQKLLWRLKCKKSTIWSNRIEWHMQHMVPYDIRYTLNIARKCAHSFVYLGCI